MGLDQLDVPDIGEAPLGIAAPFALVGAGHGQFDRPDLENAVGERMTAFIERQNGAANGIIRQEFVIEVYST